MPDLSRLVGRATPLAICPLFQIQDPRGSIKSHHTGDMAGLEEWKGFGAITNLRPGRVVHDIRTRRAWGLGVAPGEG